VREIAVCVRIEIGQRIVDVYALSTREEDVVRVIVLEGRTERQRMVADVTREVVLNLKLVIQEGVARCKRLVTKGRVNRICLQDIDKRKQTSMLRTAFIVVVIGDNQLVGHLVTEKRVPVTDVRVDVLQDLVI